MGFLKYQKILDFAFFFNFFPFLHLTKYTYHLAQQKELGSLLMLKPT